MATASFAQRISVSGNTFVVNGNQIWINGANTPWQNWNDFGGSYNSGFWSSHFQTLRDNGINATRVWITCNGEVGINISSAGFVSGATTAFWSHVDDLMRIAQEKQIYLMVALISFDHTKDYHPNYQSWRNMYNSAANQQSFINNFVNPFVDRYKNNPYFFAVDVANEIDWVFEQHGVPTNTVLDLIARTANAVHGRSSVLVCQGMGTGPKYNSSVFNGNLLTDASLGARQAGAKVDFYKLHYYSWQHPYFNSPFDRSPTDWNINDKPCIVGEAPAKGPGTPSYTTTQAYERAYTLGWRGVMAWTSNGVDVNGSITELGPATQAFRNNHYALVYPTTTTPVTAATIYGDALATDWSNWSWSATVGLSNTSPVQMGTHSISVAYAGWGALSLRKGTAQSTSGYSAVKFWVHGGSGANKSIQLYTETSDSGGAGTSVNFTATAGAWTEITVSLASLGSPASIKRINFKSNSGTAQTAVYFDDIRLTGGTARVGNDVALASVAPGASPNPFRDRLTLRVASPDGIPVQVRMYDRLGREVYGQTAQPVGQRVELRPAVRSGLYLLRVVANGQASEIKVVRGE